MLSRALTRFSLRILLPGMLLAACGGAPEMGLAPSEESLGTQESAMCSGASVTTLSILGVDLYDGVVAGSGDWAVTYPANAVHLDFYVDGVLRASQELKSDTRSGTWNFSYSPVGCGTHTFQVNAYPMTIDSAGNVTRCQTSGTLSNSRSFSQSCPPTASLSCSLTAPNYNCTGSGGGGTAPLTPMWRESTKSNTSTTWQEGQWYDGQWSDSFYCKPWSYSTRVEFRVRDANGLYSVIRERICSNTPEY